MSKNKNFIVLAGLTLSSLSIIGGAISTSIVNPAVKIDAASNFSQVYNAASSDVSVTNSVVSGTSFIVPYDGSYSFMTIKNVFNGRQVVNNGVTITINSSVYEEDLDKNKPNANYYSIYAENNPTGWSVFASGSGTTPTGTTATNYTRTLAQNKMDQFGTDLYIKFNAVSLARIVLNSVTISYQYEETTPTPTKTLTSVAVSGTPNKKTYEAGESLDTAGLSVTANYDDGSSKAVSSSVTWSKNPATLKAGDTSCQVKATYGGIESSWYTVSGLTVNAGKELTAIEVSGSPTKKVYEDGDYFDPTGLIVTGAYNDGTYAAVTEGITWTCDPAQLSVGVTVAIVKAFVGGVESNWYPIEGITVNEKVAATEDTYDLGAPDTYASQTASLVKWEGGNTHLSLAKGTSSYDANYSLPTASKSYINSTTAYHGHVITVAPYGDNSMSQIVITISSGFNAMANPTLTNATMSHSAGTYDYTYTPNDPKQPVVIALSGGASYECTYLKSVVVTFTKGEAVKFEDKYIKKSAYPTSGAGVDTGACRGSDGYYAKAKTAYGQLSATAGTSFCNHEDFANARARLSAWASANGEIFDPTNGSFGAGSIGFFLGSSDDSTLLYSVIGVISIAAFAGGACLVFKKKKTN